MPNILYLFVMIVLLFSIDAKSEVVSPNYSVTDFSGTTRSGGTPGEACAFTDVENHDTTCADGSSASFTITHAFSLSGATCQYDFIESAICEAASSTQTDYLPIAEECSSGFTMTGAYCTSDSESLDEENALGGPDMPQDDCLIPS